MNSVEATFTLSRDDLARFQKVVAKRFRAKGGTVLFLVQVVVWIFVGLAASSFFRMIDAHPQLTWSLRIFGVFAVLALLSLLALPFIQQAMLRKHMLMADGPFLSPQTIRLSPESMTIETTAGRNELRWSAVLAVDEDSRNRYLFIEAMQAVIIPKSVDAPFRDALDARLSDIKANS